LVLERARRDPGGALLVIALVAVAVLYSPTLGRGLVNYDDPWLVRDNWLTGHASWTSLHAICCDLGRSTRFVLGAEYLPVRDLSILADSAVWGTWYGGFHLTSLIIYEAAIAAWFFALCAFGLDRRIVGIAILVWALHPSHAESVAWIAERKGVLAALFSGLAALGYARWRGGAHVRWLVVAAACAVLAVWSKAPSVFALASLAALELVIPASASESRPLHSGPGRASRQRSFVGLGVIAGAATLAFVPVLVVARALGVVDGAPVGPAPGPGLALGLHGFYMRLGFATVRNAPSYPIATGGPSTLDMILGAVTLLAALALLVPRVRTELRAGAAIWLVGFIPLSRLVLPVRGVVLADRYLLVPSLGLALVVGALAMMLEDRRLRAALVLTLAFALAMRTLDAQANWRDPVTLWQRAVAVNPRDGDAWSMYAEALDDAGEQQQAIEAVLRGMHRTSSPRLVMREALIVLEHGDRTKGENLMRTAARGGEPRAMANLALLELADGQTADALAWARKSATVAPLYANGQRTHGKVALAAHEPAEALQAFQQALALEPESVANRFNLALALIDLGRRSEARPYLEACLHDPGLGPRATALLEAAP